MKRNDTPGCFRAPPRDPSRILREQIADHVRSAIQSGAILPGCQLPPMRVLAKEWGADPMTVHRALATLEQEGLLIRRHGKGSFVRERSRSLKTIGLYYCGGALAHPEFRYLRAMHRALMDRIEASGRNWDVWNDPRPVEESERPWPALVDAIQRGSIDALVATQVDARHAVWLGKLPLPVAVLGSRHLPNSVSFDHSQLPRLAVDALVRQGCRSVGLISAWPSHPFEPEHTADVLVTYQTFMAEVKRHGLLTRGTWNVTPTEFRRTPPVSCEEWGYRAFMQVWDQPEHPDGLVVINDAEALGVTMAILEKGVRVPGQLRLAYHKNAEVSLFCPLSVTHLVSSADAAAAALLDLVQRQFAGEKTASAELGVTVEEPDRDVSEALAKLRTR